MPRKPLIANPLLPYHLTARSNNRDWFHLPLDHVWAIMGRFLYLLRHADEIRIHSFVLMPNHFHLLAHFPKGNVATTMQYFMRETSRCIAHESGRINHVYGGRYFRSVIDSHHYFMHVYKYVYRNPVEARLCTHVWEYPYSTLSGLLGQTHLLIPVEQDTLIFELNSMAQTLAWLERTPHWEDKETVRRALRKSEFKLAKDKGGKENQLEWLSY